eukprot:174118_1
MYTFLMMQFPEMNGRRHTASMNGHPIASALPLSQKLRAYRYISSKTNIVTFRSTSILRSLTPTIISTNSSAFAFAFTSSTSSVSSINKIVATAMTMSSATIVTSATI